MFSQKVVLMDQAIKNIPDLNCSQHQADQIIWAVFAPFCDELDSSYTIGQRKISCTLDFPSKTDGNELYSSIPDKTEYGKIYSSYPL